ncbi:MAG: hypothetical protein K0U70_00875 [Actinomycetia bacterium]|nr:hypothetical protein [Actinomycetes bacterium]MCH9708240.1 hypothetical protein [Actinomycetes bacterium]MCH9766330.1 hypothetical protein [Actinomycetes bacterium]
MTAGVAVAVVMALAGAGLVASQLIRLRAWLDKPPPDPEPPEDSMP